MSSSHILTARNLAQSFPQLIKKVHTEDDLRVGVARALNATLRALGLTLIPQYGKTTLSGSADPIYGYVATVYKRPGCLAREGFPVA
jgi:hypothetical protein